MPLVVAHRGLSATHPEHTLAAYQAALPYADGFECDVRLTRDRRLVCWHDSTLNRTSSLTGRVSTTWWRDLAAIDPRPMLLDDLVTLAVENGKSLFIETKHPVRYGNAVERAVHRLLTSRSKEISDYGVDIHLMSFAFSAVRRFAAMPGNAVQLLEYPAMSIPTRHAGFVGVNYRRITRRFVEVARGRGQSVLAWTVNDLDAAVRLAEWGVHAIISDRADEVRARLG